MSDTQETTQSTEKKEDNRKTIYLNRLSMYSSTVQGGPRLLWALFDGNPRIIVRTNDPNDEQNNYGQITAPIDPFTCSALALMIKEAAKAEPGYRAKIVNKSTWHNGKKHDEPVRINDIIVGKDNDGGVYISLHEDNRPNIRFFFGPSSWHLLVKSDGSPVSKAEFSPLYAVAYADLLLATISSIIGYGSYVSTYTDHDGNSQEQKPVFSKGGSGGYNRGGGNYNRGGGNYNRGGGGNYNRGGYNRGGGGGNNRSGGGNYGGGGGYQNRQQQQQQAVENMSSEDIDY